MKALLQRIIELLILIYQTLSEKHAPIPIPLEADVWMDSYDVMQLLNVSYATLYRAREANELIAKKIGRKWFYLKSSLC